MLPVILIISLPSFLQSAENMAGSVMKGHLELRSESIEFKRSFPKEVAVSQGEFLTINPVKLDWDTVASGQ